MYCFRYVVFVYWQGQRDGCCPDDEDEACYRIHREESARAIEIEVVAGASRVELLLGFAVTYVPAASVMYRDNHRKLWILRWTPLLALSCWISD